MAAIFAATEGAETTLFESSDDGGRKILISGGGRCNVLPARLDETRFITDSSPHTLRNIVRSWPLAEQRAFFERDLALPLKEEAESAKLFPVSDKARDVRDGLLALARRKGVRVRTGTRVTGVRRAGDIWQVQVNDADNNDVDAVIVASGGLSVPSTGSDGFGLRLAKTLGHTVHETYAALTPITAEPAPFAHLSGVSLTVTITAQDDTRKAVATGGFLFTHRGYSGPSVLDVSHVVTRSRAESPARLWVNWASRSEADWDADLKANGARQVVAVLRERLPERLALALLAMTAIEPAKPLAQVRREERLALLQALTRCELPWTSHEGYKKAEVTGGGVNLAEIDPRTMESRKQPGLFLCGELLDAFGPIGGYNFLWAWATGRAAGLGAARGA
jgi:predicted Rossmann fold flavoprotein